MAVVAVAAMAVAVPCSGKGGSGSGSSGSGSRGGIEDRRSLTTSVTEMGATKIAAAEIHFGKAFVRFLTYLIQ